MVGGSSDRSPRGVDLRRHVTRVGVDIPDDRRSGTFEGDHFKCSHGALISRRQWAVARFEPLLPGSCWRLVNARYGFRGERVGEASHPGPPLLRRLRSGRGRVVPADISSDEKPLVRHVHRHVVPRIAGVASVADVTQVDVADVEDHSAVSQTLLDSLAEDLSQTHPYTNLRDVGRIGGQILPGAHRDADEFSSASSESCLGEREDIGDEEVEWSALPPPSRQADDRVSLREGDHDRPRVRRLHLISSQSVAPASSSPQIACNRFAAVPHNSQSGSFFGWADVVHIGTPRQQVSRDARTAQVENEAEDDSVVNALQQDLEPSSVGNASDPIGPTVVDSGLHQRANRFSPLTAEIEEEPLSAGFVTQPESLVLRPTVAESDTDSRESKHFRGV